MLIGSPALRRARTERISVSIRLALSVVPGNSATFVMLSGAVVYRLPLGRRNGLLVCWDDSEGIVAMLALAFAVRRR